MKTKVVQRLQAFTLYEKKRLSVVNEALFCVLHAITTITLLEDVPYANIYHLRVVEIRCGVVKRSGGVVKMRGGVVRVRGELGLV